MSTNNYPTISEIIAAAASKPAPTSAGRITLSAGGPRPIQTPLTGPSQSLISLLSSGTSLINQPAPAQPLQLRSLSATSIPSSTVTSLLNAPLLTRPSELRPTLSATPLAPLSRGTGISAGLITRATSGPTSSLLPVGTVVDMEELMRWEDIENERRGLPKHRLPPTGEILPVIYNFNEITCERYKTRMAQDEALAYIRRREAMGNGHGGIIALDVGQGKTLTGLTRIAEDKLNGPTLIVCPVEVINNAWINDIIKFFSITKRADNSKSLTEAERIAMNRPESGSTRIQYLVFYAPGNSKRRSELERMSAKEIANYDVVITNYESLRGKYPSKEFKNSKDTLLYLPKRISKSFNNRGGIKSYRQATPSDILPNTFGIEALYNIIWRRVIADESQILVDNKSQTFRSMLSLVAEHKFSFTATFMKNKYAEMWSQVFFCGNTEVDTPKDFRIENFLATPSMRDNLFTPSKEAVEEIMGELPPMEEIIVYTTGTLIEKKIYAYYFLDLWYKLTQREKQSKDEASIISASQIITLFLRLRQISIAPWLITAKAQHSDSYDPSEEPTDLANPANSPEDQELESHIHDINECGFGSGKITEILRILATEVYSTRNNEVPNKVVIFSYFKTALDLIALGIHLGFNLDPATNAHKPISEQLLFYNISSDVEMRERPGQIADFSTNPRVQVLLINSLIGGQGLNLQAANIGIIVEPWYSPHMKKQNIGRLYRQGQKRPVKIYIMIANGTVEKLIRKIGKQKTALIQHICDPSIEAEKPTSLDFDTLKEIMKTAWDEFKDDFRMTRPVRGTTLLGSGGEKKPSSPTSLLGSASSPSLLGSLLKSSGGSLSKSSGGSLSKSSGGSLLTSSGGSLLTSSGLLGPSTGSLLSSASPSLLSPAAVPKLVPTSLPSLIATPKLSPSSLLTSIPSLQGLAAVPKLAPTSSLGPIATPKLSPASSLSSLQSLTAVPKLAPASSLQSLTAVPKLAPASSLQSLTAVPKLAPASSLQSLTAVPKLAPASSLQSLTAVPKLASASSLQSLTAVSVPKLTSASSLQSLGTAVPVPKLAPASSLQSLGTAVPVPKLTSAPSLSSQTTPIVPTSSLLEMLMSRSKQ